MSKGERLPMSTARAILTPIRGVHRHRLATGPCCLVRKQAGELAPGYVVDALSETVVAPQAMEREVFNRDDSIGVHDTATVLRGEVTTPPARA
jgi:hypothetical protein